MNDAPAKIGFVPHLQHNTLATSTSMRFWARSIGDRNPRHISEGYAPNGTPSFVAHPCWLYSVNDTAINCGKSGQVALIAGAKWKFARPVLIGDRVRAHAELLEQRVVQGRHAGESVLQNVLVRYADTYDRPLASVEATVMRVDAERARLSTKYEQWKRWKYTPAELASIEKAYDAERVNGDPVYLDDIGSGTTLPGIVRGPVTSEEMVLFTGATRSAVSISEFMRGLRDGSMAGFIHPRTGTFETFAAGLVDDDSALQLGFPAAHDYGIDRISQAASLVTNWIGDHGRLRELEVRLLGPCMLGDATWFSGTVTSIDRSAGRAIVDLSGVNQRGEKTLGGHAAVDLPIRGRGRESMT